jgi:hypothetical protein
MVARQPNREMQSYKSFRMLPGLENINTLNCFSQKSRRGISEEGGDARRGCFLGDPPHYI